MMSYWIFACLGSVVVTGTEMLVIFRPLKRQERRIKALEAHPIFDEGELLVTALTAADRYTAFVVQQVQASFTKQFKMALPHDSITVHSAPRGEGIVQVCGTTLAFKSRYGVDPDTIDRLQTWTFWGDVHGESRAITNIELLGLAIKGANVPAAEPVAS